jgi:hypothetical protein
MYIININNNNFENFENLDIPMYKTKMLNNNKEKLFKIGFNDKIEIRREDCFFKCDQEKCIKLDNMTKLLDKCNKCNLQYNKCFQKTVIGGNCNDCDESKIEKINCNDIKNFGCPPPDNIDNNNGVEPYYIQVPDNNVNSPYNEKCSFCWDILDEI